MGSAEKARMSAVIGGYRRVLFQRHGLCFHKLLIVL
jgi:hypothetical protein